MTELHRPVVLPIDSVHPVEWNPNEEDLGTFNNLVESIQEEGFLDPVTVVPIPDTDGEYALIRGEHRWKAAKLAGLSEITGFVVDWSADEQKVRSVRHNVIRGRFDPERFVDLYEQLRKKYDRPALAHALGMQHQEKALQKLISDAGRGLPKPLRDELAARADKIRNVEDLAAVIQSLYARFGSTLDHSYMFLTFGGRIHLMVKMDDDTKKRVEAKLDEIVSNGGDANEVIRAALDAVV